MSTFNTNNTTNTKKARAAAGTSAKKVFHRPTAKQVEKMAEARVKKGEIKLPPVKILYLAKASDAERESALKTFIACAGGSTPPTPPTPPVTPVNPASPNGPMNVNIAKLTVPTILLAIDVGYHRDPRMYHSDKLQRYITENFNTNEMKTGVARRKLRCIGIRMSTGFRLHRTSSLSQSWWVRIPLPSCLWLSASSMD